MLTKERLEELEVLFSWATLNQMQYWYENGYCGIGHEEYDFYYYLWVNGPRLEPPMSMLLDGKFRREASFAEKYEDFRERKEFIEAVFARKE